MELRRTVLPMVYFAAAALTSLAASPHVAQAAAVPVVRGVSYVGVSVSDLDASTEMYAEAAALRVVAHGHIENNAALDAVAGAEGLRAEWRLLRSSNAQLRLMQFADQGPAQSSSIVPVYGPGMAHVCFQSDGTNETYQKFLARGVTPVGPKEMAVLNPQSAVVYAYARDADGIMFEVEHVDVSKAAHRAKGYYMLAHVSLGTPDIDRAVSFYSALLSPEQARRAGGEEGLAGEGFDQVSGQPGARLQMAWLGVGNLQLEIVQYLSHPTQIPDEPRPLSAHGYNMIVFDVADAGAARNRLIEAGGTVASDPQPMDDGNIFFGRDPDGNLLGFLVSPPDSIFSSRGFKAP